MIKLVIICVSILGKLFIIIEFFLCSCGVIGIFWVLLCKLVISVLRICFMWNWLWFFEIWLMVVCLKFWISCVVWLRLVFSIRVFWVIFFINFVNCWLVRVCWLKVLSKFFCVFWIIEVVVIVIFNGVFILCVMFVIKLLRVVSFLDLISWVWVFCKWVKLSVKFCVWFVICCFRFWFMIFKFNWVSLSEVMLIVVLWNLRNCLLV